MCGVPFHAADGYIARLVKKGFRVAICEQVEDPKKAKGLVRREVVRVVSPGTLTDAELSRRARAGVPDGDRRRRLTGPRPATADVRRRAARPLDRRVHDRRIPRRRRAAGAGRRDRGAAAARDRRARRTPTSPTTLPPRSRACRLPVTTADAWTLRARSRAARAARSAEDARRSRASASTAAPRAIQAAGGLVALPARHAEGRPRARPRDHATGPAPTACSSIRPR